MTARGTLNTMARAAFNWEDPLGLHDQLSVEEQAVERAARDYCQGRLAPRVLKLFREEGADPAIFREMGELGLLGATLPEEFGGAGLNYVSYVSRSV